MPFSSPRPFCFIAPRKTLAVFSLSLLIGTSGIAHAQTGAIPPPPLDASSGGGARGVYVLPGTYTKPRGGQLPTPPRSAATPAPRAPSGQPLPSPRRLTPPVDPAKANPENHRVNTPSSLRFIGTPTRGPRPSYPSPAPAQPAIAAQPAPRPLLPAAPAVQPVQPVVTPAAPLQTEWQRIEDPVSPASRVYTPPPAPRGMAPQPVPAQPSAAAAQPEALTPPPAPKAASQPVLQPIPSAPAVQAPLQPQTPPAPVWVPPHLAAPSSTTEDDDVLAEEFDALVGAPPQPMPPQLGTAPVEAAPPAAIIGTPPLEPLEFDDFGPVTTPPAPIEPAAVEPVETRELSEESRKILAKTPSGIDTKKTVRSPEPVIIRRTDPNAGLAPRGDVRAHEELGLKIEVRRADVNIQQYLEQGYDNLVNGRESIAAGYYQEALNVDPRNENALFGLATTYQRLGRREDARELYGKLLDQNPSHREGLNNFMALISEEAPQAAIAELEQLETENPDFSPIPAQLGIVYNRIGNPQMAARKLIRALQLSPENVSYKYNLALTLDQLGQHEEASDMYMELIEAYNSGATLPGDVEDIRNRLIFINTKR